MLKLSSFRLLLIGICTTIAIFIGVQIPSPSVGLQSVVAQPEWPVPLAQALPATVQAPSRYGKGIRRTLYLLATSTPKHRNTVRILFYGQSITKQQWWLEVTNNLRQRFPYANLIVENRAIGGFASPLLVRTAQHDLYPFYPDLMIFHVYGDEENYEAIIANTRRRTTAEIALASDHIDWLPTGVEGEDSEQLKRYRWHNRHIQWLSTLAQKYGCELIDVRTAWEQYLKLHNLQPQALLEDDIHLNQQGNHLMASLITTHLLQSSIPQAKALDNRVTEYQNSALHGQDGKLSLEFVGNRVELIAPSNTGSHLAPAQILIDGQPPSHFSDLYTITRPSDAPGVDWPGIIQIESVSPLIKEDWTLLITQVNSQVNQFSFDLYGSQTGFDGSGNSQQKFVSNSGRILIEPQNWWLGNAYQFTHQSIPIGFPIRWRVEPMFTDFYTPPAIQDTTREYTTVIAQNLPNSRHTLEITALTGSPVSIETIRVYHPSID